jgi:hypothetical protein
LPSNISLLLSVTNNEKHDYVKYDETKGCHPYVRCILKARHIFTIDYFGYGGKSAKGFSEKYFERIGNSEKNLSERIFKLRTKMQGVGEGETCFRYFCVSRIFFR